MLQTMRDRMKGTAAFIIVGFLGLILALSLVNLNQPGGVNYFDEVASVNGEAITERDVQLAILQEKNRLQSQFGNNLPPQFLSDERLRQPALQQLIQRNVLLDKAYSGNLNISDSQLNQRITQIPAFQVEGVFDNQIFLNTVRGIGHTVNSFRNLLRDDVIVSQLQTAFVNTAFVTDKEVKQSVSLARQTRDFSYVILPLKDLPAKMDVSDEEIGAYYETNKQNYNTEEQVAVEYIQMAVADFLETITISDEAIKEQYDLEVGSFTAAIEREAAHILIEGDDDESIAKIAEVQQKLSEGGDFSELAKEYSDDFGSRESGGNLGVTTGDSFPAAFEETLLTLEQDEVSEAVEIDGNTHFIKLLAIKGDKPPTYDDSKERIAQELKTTEAEQIYLEQLTALKDLAYNAEDLTEVAEQLELKYRTTDLFTARGGADAVLSDRRVVEAAFSEQVLQQGFTSEVIELAPDKSVVINLLTHEPVRTLTLEEKTADISTELKLEKAKAQLAEQAASLKEALAAGTSLEQIAKDNELELKSELKYARDSRSLSADLVTHVFAQPRPEPGEPITSSFYLANNDYALVSVSAVNDAVFDELTDEEKRNARLTLVRSSAGTEFRAWQDQLMELADVEIKGAPSTQ